MSANKGLGRGLDSLIPKTIDTSALLEKNERIQNIPVKDIIADSEQPRTQFDETKLAELATSIKRHGVLQPIIVTRNEQNLYTIIAGERRWRAAKLASLSAVPCIVRSLEKIEKLEIALIENVQRVDLSPLEQAISIERLHQQFNVPYKLIAERLGKAATTINNIVRLLQLPDDAKQALQEGEISEGHARALLAIKEFPGAQSALLVKIIKEGLTVRQAEQYAIGVKSEQKTQDAKPAVDRLIQKTSETKLLEKRLSTDVRVRRTAKGGRIEIAFKSDEELETIISTLL